MIIPIGRTLMIMAVLSVGANADADLPQDLADDFQNLRWIAFSPSEGNPSAGQWPPSASIKRDLRLLRLFGFDAIVTYSSVEGANVIPQFARAEGFKRVIAGIWNPNDRKEVQSALAIKEYVDGYCVGNEGIGREGKDGYFLSDVKRVIDEIRTKAKKPSATTEQLGDYLVSGAELINVGDWVFPNVHPYYANQRTPEAAVSWTMEQYRQLKELAGDRLVVLKEIGLPTGPNYDAGESFQSEFFSTIVGTHIPLVVFEAFDQPWKTSSTTEAEPYWGIFNSKRAPKLAAFTLNDVFSNRGETLDESTTIARKPTTDLNISMSSDKRIRITSPAHGAAAFTRRQVDGGTFHVTGTSTDIYGTDRVIIVFVNPTEPSAGGWYVQLQAMSPVKQDGQWSSPVMIGNVKYPPQSGHVVSIAAGAFSASDAEQILQTAEQDPSRPLMRLPAVDAAFMDTVENITIQIGRDDAAVDGIR